MAMQWIVPAWRVEKALRARKAFSATEKVRESWVLVVGGSMMCGGQERYGGGSGLAYMDTRNVEGRQLWWACLWAAGVCCRRVGGRPRLVGGWARPLAGEGT